MGKTCIPGRVAGLVAILSLAAALPACRSADGTRAPLFGGPKPDTTNTVMRPAYPWPETKPLFLSGYAGATYEPRARMAPVFVSPGPAPAPVTATPPTVTVNQGTWGSN